MKKQTKELFKKRSVNSPSSSKFNRKDINFQSRYSPSLLFLAQKPKNTWKSHRKVMFWCLFRLNFEDEGATRLSTDRKFSKLSEVFCCDSFSVFSLFPMYNVKLTNFFTSFLMIYLHSSRYFLSNALVNFTIFSKCK